MPTYELKFIRGGAVRTIELEGEDLCVGRREDKRVVLTPDGRPKAAVPIADYIALNELPERREFEWADKRHL